MAEKVGVSAASVSRWELGHDNPTHERLESIAKAVGAVDSETGVARLDVFYGWLPPLAGEPTNGAEAS